MANIPKQHIKNSINWVTTAAGIKTILSIVGVIGFVFYWVISNSTIIIAQIDSNTTKVDTVIVEIEWLKTEHTKSQQQFMDAHQQILDAFTESSNRTVNRLDSLLNK